MNLTLKKLILVFMRASTTCLFFSYGKVWYAQRVKGSR